MQHEFVDYKKQNAEEMETLKRKECKIEKEGGGREASQGKMSWGYCAREAEDPVQRSIP